MEFTYPSSFLPGVGPEDPLSNPLTPATYFIGEAKVSAVPPGGEQIVVVEWPPALIPPEEVPTAAGPVMWHPCLLAHVAPHDGPAASGDHVWDYDNLAQKNISIVDASPGSEFGMAMTMGGAGNDGDSLLLEVLRGELHDVQLFLDLLDLPLPKPPSGCEDWSIGQRNGREVVLLAPLPEVLVPIPTRPRGISLVVVRGVVGAKAKVGAYEVRMVQRQSTGKLSGAAVLSLNIHDRNTPT
jgi:hypothetical protein